MKVFAPLLVFACLFLTACQPDGPARADAPGVAPAGNPVGTQPANGGQLPADLGDGGPGYAPPGYALVWSDEFNYEGLPDPEKWGYQTGGFGWLAEELQNYLEADPDNVGVAGGVLRITALAEEAGRNKYSSTRLVTKRKAEFTYGYFEVRAQLPTGTGLRSSFWMVGDTVSKMGWPNAGEIDIFEHYGKFSTIVNAAVQTKNNSWNQKNQKGASKIVKGIEEEFHTYAVEWSPDYVRFFVDGEQYFDYPNGEYLGAAGYPFQWPFYMAATLSVGGFRGVPSEVKPEVFPANMYIDYVRVYQK